MFTIERPSPPSLASLEASAWSTLADRIDPANKVEVVPVDERRAALWTPQPGPQLDAMASPADIIGYGGAAGGGKSDLALGLSLTRHYRSVIFRREAVQHAELLRRAKLVTAGFREGFNGSSPPTLTLPGGATIEFGAMKDRDDWQKWAGRPHDFQCFDEATQFLESQVRAVMAWTRTERIGQRCLNLLTFNPPTNEEGEWVIAFFAPWLDPEHPKPASPGELRWYVQLPDKDGKVVDKEVDGPGEIMLENGERVRPTSRTFFPARIEDNEYYNRDGEYKRRLQSTPEPLRSQLLYGSFTSSRAVDRWRICPRPWVLAAVARGRERAFGTPIAYGLDIAHGGDDNTVAAPRDSQGIGELQVATGKETPDGKTAAAWFMAIFQPGAYVNCDAIGYGASATERLADPPEQGGYGIAAHAVNVATKDTGLPVPASEYQIQKSGFRYTDKSGKFLMVNRRAEMYWRLREALDPENGHDFTLPNDPQLISDLCAARYEITPSGIKVESKDEIKARLPGNRSPDRGDAVALSMLPPASPRETLVLTRPALRIAGIRRTVDRLV